MTHSEWYAEFKKEAIEIATKSLNLNGQIEENIKECLRRNDNKPIDLAIEGLKGELIGVAWNGFWSISPAETLEIGADLEILEVQSNTSEEIICKAFDYEECETRILTFSSLPISIRLAIYHRCIESLKLE